MLVDHVQELEPAAVSGGDELDIHGTDLIRMFGLVATHLAISRPGPLLPAGSRALHPFLAPKGVHPFEIDSPAFPPEQAIRHPPTPADVFSCEIPEASPQNGLLNVDNLGEMSLRVEVLAHDPVGVALLYPEHSAQGLNSPAAAMRAKKFPSANYSSITFFSSASARSFLRWTFSFSS